MSPRDAARSIPAPTSCAGIRPAERALRSAFSPEALLSTAAANTLRELFRHNDWAGAKVLHAARSCTDAALERGFPIGLGSLRKTLSHICDAERWWLANWRGEAPGAFAAMPPGAALDSVKEALAEASRGREAFLATCADAQLTGVVEAQASAELRLKFRLGESMLQIPTHGTHHRAQALNMLKRLGAAPPAVDYVLWLRSRE